MLALTVRDGDYITIGGDIVVQVVKTGDTFRLAIEAPRAMKIERSVHHERESSVPACIQRVRRQAPPRYLSRRHLHGEEDGVC